MLPLQRLEGFYWVARTQGYARAARAFPYPITQPGVHQQVRRLETDLGVRLFERVGKDRVVLTPAGRVLYDFAAPFLERLPSVLDSVRHGTFGGTLRIHAAGFSLRHILPAWLRRLQKQRPDVLVALCEVMTADLQLLRSGESDLLVDYLETVPSDIDVRQVATSRPFLVLPKEHPLAQRKQLSLDALKDEPFVAYHTDSKLQALQLKALELHGVTPRISHAADSSDTILGFVAAGLGFSLVPSLDAQGPRVEGVIAHPVTRPKVEFPIYAAWRKTNVPQPLIEAALALAP